MSHQVPSNFQVRSIIEPDVNGFVSKKFLQYYIGERIRNSSLQSFVPTNAARFGVQDGAPEQWAKHFLSVIEYASGFNSRFFDSVITFKNEKRVQEVRVGLFALNPDEVNSTVDLLYKPEINIEKALEKFTTRILLKSSIDEYK